MIQRFKQRTRQMAHSVGERGPDIFLVLLAVLVMASATGVAQSGGGIVIDDFEDGDISDWSHGSLVTENPIQGEYSYEQGGDDTNSHKDIEELPYDRMSFVMVHNGSTGEFPEAQVEYNHDQNQFSALTSVGVTGNDGQIQQNNNGVGENVPEGVPVVFVSEFDWASTEVTHSVRYYENGTMIWQGDPIGLNDPQSEIGAVEYREQNYNAKIDVIQANATDDELLAPRETNLSIETRDLFIPGNTHPYTVYQEIESTDGTPNESEDVTEEATVTTDSSLLTVNDNQTMTATAGENESAVVNVTASYEGENTTKQVVVSRPTVQNLEILPTGITRVWAVGTDNTIFALLIAAFMGVAATRYAGAFAGLATAEMVIVIGWLGGYVGLGMAMVSVFMAMFIGLNLAANIDYSVTRR